MSNSIIFNNRVKNSQPLAFNNVELQTVDIGDKQVWITSKSLADALGYKSTKDVTNLYNSYADEFTGQMSKSIPNSGVGDSPTGINTGFAEQVKVRIFSLRGCHLIAMFSRTKIAKDFRKFVLDILDNENKKEIRQISVPTEMGKWKYHNITKVRRDLLGCKMEKLPLSAYEDRKHLIDKWKCLNYVKNTVLFRGELHKQVHPEKATGKHDFKKLTQFDMDTHEEIGLEYFTHEHQNWFAIADLGNEEIMQEKGLYYYVARLPQEMKLQAKPGYPFSLMKKSVVHELFADCPKIYVSEKGLETLMNDLSNSSKLPSKIYQFQIQHREQMSLAV